MFAAADTADVEAFTVARNTDGAVTGIVVHDANGEGSRLDGHAANNMVAFCNTHQSATASVTSVSVAYTVSAAQRIGLHALHGVADPRFGVVNDWNGTPRPVVLDEQMANWALDTGVAKTFTSATGDPLVHLYAIWRPEAVADCFDHPMTPERWGTIKKGMIIRHPTSCWQGNPDATDGDIVFHSYDPETGHLSYSEIGSTNVNTVFPEFAALFRTYPTGTPE